MGVLTDSLCFCKGSGKSERIKAAIFSGKGPAMAIICGAGAGGSATGFFIHRNLMLTTHAFIPSVAAAETAQIRLHDGVVSSLFPHRFFITSSILDLTVVALDKMEGESSVFGQQHHYLKTSSKPNLDLGSTVYILGYSMEKNLRVQEAKVVIATDNLIKISTDGVNWSSGSAGFDAHGNLAFIICDPMKLNAKSSTTSSSSSTSSKKDNVLMQFGIPIPIVSDWLNQHWEGNHNKLKLPLMRLMSNGQKSECSSSSFTHRQIFKPNEEESDHNNTLLFKPMHEVNSSVTEETLTDDLLANMHGIQSAVIYESPKLCAIPLEKKHSPQVQILDISFPPARETLPSMHPRPESVKRVTSSCGENYAIGDAKIVNGEEPSVEMGSIGSRKSEVESSSSPVGVCVVRNNHGYESSEMETMYSAETAESRNYVSPRETKKMMMIQSQSCESLRKKGGNCRGMAPETRRNSFYGGRVYSQGASSQRSNDYCSPTVASIMKKRNNLEEPKRPHPAKMVLHSSPRWMF